MVIDSYSTAPLISSTCRKNCRWGSTSHKVTVDVDKWIPNKNRLMFEADDYPYLRLALLDMFIEDEYK